MRVMQALEVTTDFDTPETALTPFESQALRVFDIVSNGNTIPAAMRELGIDSSIMTFLRRVKQSPILRRAFDDARMAQAASFAEQIIDIADNERDSARARNKLDARKWLASKLDPKTFGDKLDLSIDQTVSIRAALDAAETRIVRPMRDLAPESDSQVIDLTAITEPASSDNESLSTPQTKDAASLTLDDLLG